MVALKYMVIALASSAAGIICLKADYPVVGMLLLFSGFIAPFVLQALGAMESEPTRKFGTLPTQREDQPKEVVLRLEQHHVNHNLNYTQVTEGQEISQEMPDGTIRKITQIRRWQ
jgi:hypothetical protein